MSIHHMSALLVMAICLAIRVNAQSIANNDVLRRLEDLKTLPDDFETARTFQTTQA